MVSDLLLRYGWSDAVAALLHPDELPARVLRVDRGECDVVTPDGETRVRTGRHAPCTGDWVTLRNNVIERILPRRSAIRRSSASNRSDEQVLAANVDTVAITTALDGRGDRDDVGLGRIERMLALAWESGAQPVVVLTKCDTVSDPEVNIARVATIAPGAGVLAVSAATGVGLMDLTSWLRGTVVLIGPSGSGKSTLVNALLGEDLLATGAVRAADHKGRHTTVRRELIPLAHPPSLRSPQEGYPPSLRSPQVTYAQIIDTPGLRAVGLWDVTDGIDLAFADITELATGCRFDDCAHQGEPGCAVDAAVNDGQVDARRLVSYRKLTRENAWIQARADARLRSERNRAQRAQSRAQRAMYRERRR